MSSLTTPLLQYGSSENTAVTSTQWYSSQERIRFALCPMSGSTRMSVFCLRKQCSVPTISLLQFVPTVHSAAKLPYSLQMDPLAPVQLLTIYSLIHSTLAYLQQRNAKFYLLGKDALRCGLCPFSPVTESPVSHRGTYSSVSPESLKEPAERRERRQG